MSENNANIGFEKQIWDAACVLWGHIPAAEYRKVIVGLIFLRYISSAFMKRYEELVEEGEGFEDDRDAYVEENIFFVPEEARWDKIASSAHKSEIGIVIDEAMRAIEKENTSLKNVLPKNYASSDLDKRVLGDVVDLFTNMDMDNTKENKDLLGKTYQYCISKNKKQKGKTLFIDARKMGHMVDRKHRDFTEGIQEDGSLGDIDKLAKIFEDFQNGTLEEVKGFCAIADIQDIAKQDYILTPGRYVGIEEVEDDGEPFEQKMSRLTSELSDMFAKSHELEEEIRKKLGAIGYNI